jgi:penicillin-binding protein 2B
MNKNRIKARTKFLGGILTLLFFLVIFRLFWIQTVSAEWLVAQAQTMWERSGKLSPDRGTIHDRNGQILAYTSKAYTVIAKLKPWDKNDSGYVLNALETGQKLSPIIDMPAEKIAKMIESGRTTNRSQVELRPGGWKINEEKAQQVADLKLPGILLFEEKKRYYPNDAFASHVLGYTDLDGKAVMGIERVFNDVLKGEEGEYQLLKDGRGFKLPGAMESYRPAKDGESIYLTIDYQIQNYVEEALNNVTAQYKTKSVSVIVMDPSTGEVLAMANRPDFNPNKYQDITNWTNYAVSSTFEPGSTFKIVTLAAAIEEGLYRNDEVYKSGSYRNIPGPPINDHQRAGWGEISFLRGVQESSNVLFTILGYERLGKDKLYDYFQKFGFGNATGIGLPNEAAAQLKDKQRLYPRDVASMTFGQGVVVTAIQQVAAVSAIANGGELLKPYIVKEMRDSHSGQLTFKNEKEVIRRVVSEDTAAQVRDILQKVVTADGTGRYFSLDGYQVAGKTGTAQVVGLDGKYMKNEYIYNFVGFAPKDNPKLLVYVVADQPEILDSRFGGRDVVSPIFKDVMRNSLQYLKVSPDITETSKEVSVQKAKAFSVPDLVKKTPIMAEQALTEAGLEILVVGEGSKVLRQYPASGEKVIEGNVVYAITDESSQTMLPDFIGKTLREVMELCTMIGVKVDIEGGGFVVSQSLPPGTIVTRGETLQIVLQTKQEESPPQIKTEADSAERVSPPPAPEGQMD